MTSGCLLFAAGAAGAASSLDEVRATLAALRDELAADASRLGDAREQAFELARRIDETQARLRDAIAAIERKEARIAQLKTEQQELNGYLDTQRNRFAQTAVQRYALSRQPRIKLLLNQGSVARISRLVSYHDYLLHQQQRELDSATQHLARLAASETALRVETGAARLLREEQRERAARLDGLRAEQELLMAAIEQRLSDRKLRVSELERDEERLLELVQEVAADHDTAPAQARTPFASGKGRFEWPVSGRVAKAPGRALRQGGARWAGVLIDGPPGDPVRAVAGGKVVFADWFRNLGKLVIIDHGDGYLTLYGNNRTVSARAGDSVQAGDTIATVGGGSGDMPAGLYFELRSHGEPLDPRGWFARR